MKTIIKTTALFLGLAVLSTSAFAANKVTEDPKAKTVAAPAKQNVVLFNSLAQDHGVQVIVHNLAAASSSVKIYDAAGNAIMTDVLNKKDSVARKGYDLTQLEDGDYIIQVTTNNQVVKKLVHVYNDENNQRAFFFKI